MIKSAVGCESSVNSPPSTLVSSSHVGRRVEVEGVGEGTLRYVGGINGKNGLFCGIELDHPTGKHDGSFQGFSYFSCPSLHGIFAPLYKVTLVSLPSNVPLPQSKTFLLQQQEQQRLSRSALPSLDLRSVAAPSSSPSGWSDREDISMHSSMQSSQSSMASSLLNQSYVMNGSWQFGDDMLASNNTYVLPGRSYGEEDDLMSVPVRESILDRALTDMHIATSLVLDESRIGVENLPVIGSPLHSPMGDGSDGVTPMVESMPSLGEQMEDDEEWRDRQSTPIQEESHSEYSDDRAITAMSEEGRNEQEEKSEERQEDMDKEDKKKNVHKGSKGDVPPSTVKAKKTVVKKVVEVKKVEERPKKERAPLCPPSTSAKFPVKPKAPSKHQLMMEKLKASMEAEKADKEKMKKEEKKPRMSLLPQPPSNGMKTDENAPLPMAPPISSRERTNSSLSVKTPLKQVTNTSSVPSTSTSSVTPARSTVVRKPRMSLLPPPPAAKKEEKEKEKEKSTVVNVSKGNGVRGTSTTSFPTSSFAPKTIGSTRKRIETTKETNKKKKELSDEEKLARLSHSNRVVDVLGVTIQRIIGEKEKKDGMIDKLEKEKGECQSRVDQLVHRLNETEKAKRCELEELHASNEKTIVSLRDELTRQLKEKESVHALTLEEEKTKYEERIGEMTARHQQTCALLDEKNAETERALEEAIKEKKKLHNALATDHDTKVQTLSQEITSLNTALQMKSSEMKELRLKNQHLTMSVEEIPGKDLEISKLRHKIADLKMQLDQKHEREKLLVQQNEELRRKERNSFSRSESYRNQVDVLQFQLGLSNENGSEEGPIAEEGGFDQSAYFTPVRMRKKRVESDERPYSYTLPSSARASQSRNSDDSMTRSVVGMYSANKAHTKSSALDRDVIYAPDQVITSNPRKLSFGEEDEREERESVKGGQTDSGIGI